MSSPSNTRFLTLGIMIAIILGAFIGWAFTRFCALRELVGADFQALFGYDRNALGSHFDYGWHE